MQYLIGHTFRIQMGEVSLAGVLLLSCGALELLKKKMHQYNQEIPC